MIGLLSPVAGYVWLAAAWVFLLAVAWKRWRARERRDAAGTRKALKRLLADTSHLHEMDAL